MGALTVVIEDGENLYGALVSTDGVRDHRGELCCVAGFDKDGALTQLQARGPRKNREPFVSGMHTQLRDIYRPHHRSDPHLGYGDPVRTALAGEGPYRPAVLGVGLGTDHHIVVIDSFDQLIEGGAEGLGDRHQLVEGDASVAGFDAAQRGGAQVATGSKCVEGPTSGLT